MMAAIAFIWNSTCEIKEIMGNSLIRREWKGVSGRRGERDQWMNMRPTFELTEAAVARFRVVYSVWLFLSLLFLFLEISFVTSFLNSIPDENESESDIFSRIAVTLLFVSLVFETCFLLSGAGAIISMGSEPLQLHYVFSCTSLPLTVIISLVAIWTNVTLVTASFITLFVAKVGALFLLFVVKHATIVEPEAPVSFYAEFRSSVVE